MPLKGPAVDPVIDPVYLSDIRALSPALVKEVVQRFLEHAPIRMGALRAAVEARDASGVGREAHALRGSCAVVGAMGMIARCAALEALAKEGDVASADLAALDQEFARVREAITRMAEA